jgi:regulatory protein
MDGGRARARKPSLAERRERRAAVEDVNEVLDAAARFLEARPRSVAEVRRRLDSQGYRPELVHGAIARLLELGYLDDEAFARAWAESRDRARPRGERALRVELDRKGVDRSVVRAVLGDRRDAARDALAATGAPEGHLEEAGAERLLRGRLAAILREPDARRRRQRAYGLLARNGFDPDVCSAVVRRILDEAATDVAADEPDPDPAGP